MFNKIIQILGWRSFAARKFRSDELGAVAVIFALMLAPLLIGVAAGVDYSRAVNMRSRLTAAADAAALAGVTAASQPSVVFGQRATVGNAAAAKYFSGNAESGAYTDLAHTETLTTDASGAIAQKVCFTAKLNSVFAGVAGLKAFDIANCVTAQAATSPYVDFHIVIDVSESMGIGATPTDQAKVASTTPDNCVFACHYFSQDAGARSAGATLRIDMVKQAVANVLNITGASNSKATFSLYKFSNTMSKFSAKTDSMATKISKLNALGIDSYTSGGGGTNLSHALNTLASSVTGGTGATSASPIVYVIVLTDGIENSARLKAPTSEAVIVWDYDPNFYEQSESYYMNFWYGQRIQAFGTSGCTALKSKNVKLAMLLTPYFQMQGATQWFDVVRDNYINDTARPLSVSNAKSCASSSSLYAQIDNSAALMTNLTRILTAATKPIALTN